MQHQGEQKGGQRVSLVEPCFAAEGCVTKLELGVGAIRGQNPGEALRKDTLHLLEGGVPVGLIECIDEVTLEKGAGWVILKSLSDGVDNCLATAPLFPPLTGVERGGWRLCWPALRQ